MELNGHGFEEVVVRRGRRSDLYMAIAVHSTVLGPALGGVRLWHYLDPSEAVEDAMRLARAMTYKAAASGLDLGGGKGVICAPPGDPPEGAVRHDLLLDFGDLIESLDGRYITAEDVGISPDDLMTIRERTEHVTGAPIEHGGSGDPAPFTALGVEAAMRACVREVFGTSELAGRRVAIVGLGHVGGELARRLTEAGAELVVSDLDPGKRAIADALDAEWVQPDAAILVQCDLLAPCALGGVISAANVGALRARIVCGCANNQLVDESLAEALAERGILYAPDFIVNAGGLIHVYRELRGYSEGEAHELALGIEGTMEGILATAAERAITPLAAADELAEERLALGAQVASPA
jgi:leucine dehydrogenase